MRYRVCSVGSLSAMLVLAGETMPAMAASKKAAPPPKPPWDWLLVYPVVLVLAILIAMIWLRGGPVSFSTAPPSIDKTWSFSDSWGTNVSALAAIFAAIFASSTVATDFLGKSRASTATEFATIGSVVALGFIAASPLVLSACISGDGKYTAGGLLLGVSTLIAGALGELVVDARAIAPFGIGYDIHLAWVGVLALSLVLIAYAVRASYVAITAPAPTPDELAAGISTRRPRTGMI